MDINHCWYKRVCTKKCSENCIRYRLMYSLFNQSQLPESLWEYKDLMCKQDGDMKAFRTLSGISSNMEDFVKQGHNIYIYSENPGNGKTSWAIRLMYAYFDKIWHRSCLDCKALFVNVPTFLYNCKRSISQDVKGFEALCNLISTVDLVIWDDIGEGAVSGYEHQILLQYVDGRINARKTNIYTSNKNEEELNSVIGTRLASRVYKCSNVIEFVENDKRGIL